MHVVPHLCGPAEAPGVQVGEHQQGQAPGKHGRGVQQGAWPGNQGVEQPVDEDQLVVGQTLQRKLDQRPPLALAPSRVLRNNIQKKTDA